MSYPAAVTAIQAVFIVGGVVPMMLGLRRGVVAANSIRSMRREDISFRTVWIGMTIWSVGVAFSLAAALVWHSPFQLVVWVLIAAATVWMTVTLRGLQRRVKSGEINDYADELADDDDD